MRFLYFPEIFLVRKLLSFSFVSLMSFLVISLENAIFTFVSLVVSSLTIFLALFNILIPFVESYVPAWMIIFSAWYLIKLSTISHKNYWDSLYFHEKVFKKCQTCSTIPRNPLPTGSMLCQAWKSYARQWWQGIAKQTCNQYWIRGQGVQVSLFLWLIVGPLIRFTVCSLLVYEQFLRCVFYLNLSHLSHLVFGHISSRRLQDVFKISSRHLQEVLPRRLQDVLITSSRRFPDILKTSCKDIFKTFTRHTIKLICSS